MPRTPKIYDVHEDGSFTTIKFCAPHMMEFGMTFAQAKKEALAHLRRVKFDYEYQIRMVKALRPEDVEHKEVEQ
jgi:hypothetical protein